LLVSRLGTKFAAINTCANLVSKHYGMILMRFPSHLESWGYWCVCFQNRRGEGK